MFMPQQNEMHSTALWGLVLAAGDGTRLQRYIERMKGERLPKQFVNFIGQRSMLEHTFQRAEKLILPEKILTIVGNITFSMLRYAGSCPAATKTPSSCSPPTKKPDPEFFCH